MKKYIKGNVRKILYESSSGYKVGLFKVKETNDEELSDYNNKTITFTGSFMPLNNEVTYIFYGSLFNHSRYGVQYSVSSYDVCEPTDTDGIIIYLSSGLFKGVGPALAKNIVSMFGENTMNEIKSENSKLLLVKGMNDKKAENLIKKVKELEKYNELIMSLNSFGFTTNESLVILNKYKENIKNILDNNIYLLQNDVDFLKLDTMFLRNNEQTNSVRINALIRYVITNMCYKTGDTLVKKEDLYLNLNEYFSNTLSIALYEAHLKELESNKLIIVSDDEITDASFYECEEYIAYKVNMLNKIKGSTKEVKIDKQIQLYEKNNKITLNVDQKDAIKSSLINNFSIVTGGPGTGKTTIIKAIVDIYNDLNDINLEDIILLAPTGRSAKRMNESVKRKASTIHKFLKWNKEDESFAVNSANPSEAKLVIVDEASMIDVFLFKNLLLGLKDNVKIVLVGDSFQLPSIAPGNVLHDLLNSKNINKVFLNTIYRAKEDSYIVTLANEIKNKKVFDSIEKYNDFTFIESSDMNVKEYLTDICLKVKEKGINIDAFQLLVPMYKGENGIDNINILMQSIFNPSSGLKNEIVIRNITYREEDKVIQLVNDVDNNIYNGDIGYIKKIIPGKIPLIQIDFMGNVVTFKKTKFDEFTHAYAISVHKSQGSEYENVVLVLSNSFKRMLYNKLIYTGVSRAKKSLIIVGSLDNLNYAINKEYAEKRLTNLYKLL